MAAGFCASSHVIEFHSNFITWEEIRHLIFISKLATMFFFYKSSLLRSKSQRRCEYAHIKIKVCCSLILTWRIYIIFVPSVCLYVCFRFKMADRAGVFSSRLVHSIILDRSSVVAAAVNADKVFSNEDMCSYLGYFKWISEFLSAFTLFFKSQRKMINPIYFNDSHCSRNDLFTWKLTDRTHTGSGLNSMENIQFLFKHVGQNASWLCLK